MSEVIETAAARVRTLMQLHRYDEAIAMARDALASDPQAVDLTRLLAASLIDSGDPKAGLVVAERATALEPDASDGHELRGWALHKLGRCSEAADALRHAISIEPFDSHPRTLLVECLVRAPSSRNPLRRRAHEATLQEAQDHAEEALRLDPGSAVPHLLRAKVALARNQPIVARTDIDRALAIDPNNAVGHQLLGIIAEVTGDVGRAGDHYLESARLNPRSSTSLDRLRSLKTSLPIGGIAIFIMLRIVISVGRSASIDARYVVGGACAILATVLAATAFWRPWRARRALSPKARRVLDLDRQVRGRGPVVRKVLVTVAVVVAMVWATLAVDRDLFEDDPPDPPRITPGMLDGLSGG
jgi:tetratricopeptide (TPR) repeat protein